MSNKRAVETLGMSHGAAANRLRKMVLFRQLKKHDENICVRCGKEIATVSELSIEHIKPWEGRSAELFWDLDNVGFSHMACNTADRISRSAEANKVLRITSSVPNEAWCSKCRSFKGTSTFSKGNRWNGLDDICKSCKGIKNSLRDRRKIKPDSYNDSTSVPYTESVG